MSFLAETRQGFNALTEAAFAELAPGEELTIGLNAEQQTYVRFNDSRVRQATEVSQRNLSAAFQCAGRKLVFKFDASGSQDHDLATLRSFLQRARQEARILPEDPFVEPLQNHGSSAQEHSGRLPDIAAAVACIAHGTQGTGFTGLLASGPQARAVRNSAGQDHWFSSESFFLDYSLFTTNAAGDHKAVKGRFADAVWDSERFLASLSADRDRLGLLQQPARSVAPGEYRVYFAPGAVADFIDMFSWGAVSYRAWKDGGCAFKKLMAGEVCLSEQFSLTENFALALTPRFNSLGELPPMALPVIERGRLQNLLVSSRSAKEYGVASNAADSGEYLRSAELAAGNLPEADVLKQLNTGLYVGNLHYLNWSDVQSARVTGMTRYACFWVENGEIVAPIRDLRFDDSLYRLFGPALESLTRESHVHPAVDTYYRRALGGSKTPGALVGACRFTL